MPQCRLPAVRILQPTRALRRGDGAGYRVRRHRPEGGAESAGTHDQRSRQLRAAGRAYCLRYDTRTAERGHRTQGR